MASLLYVFISTDVGQTSRTIVLFFISPNEAPVKSNCSPLQDLVYAKKKLAKMSADVSAHY